MNLYFSQKSNEKRKGGPIDLESSSKILRDRVYLFLLGGCMMQELLLIVLITKIVLVNSLRYSANMTLE